MRGRFQGGTPRQRTCVQTWAWLHAEVVTGADQDVGTNAHPGDGRIRRFRNPVGFFSSDMSRAGAWRRPGVGSGWAADGSTGPGQSVFAQSGNLDWLQASLGFALPEVDSEVVVRPAADARGPAAPRRPPAARPRSVRHDNVRNGRCFSAASRFSARVRRFRISGGTWSAKCSASDPGRGEYVNTWR